jgi:hypothetical protein
MIQKITKICICISLFSIAHANAAQNIEVPTSVQVFDEQGETRIMDPNPVLLQQEIPKKILLPPPCIQLFTDRHRENTPFSISPAHPLRTRLESQYAQLRRDVEQLHMPNTLSGNNQKIWRDAVLDLNTASTSLLALTCGTLLVDQDATSDENQKRLLQNITSTREGLLYGKAQIDTTEIREPLTLQEALYAGDLFLLSHPNISSLSFTHDTVSFDMRTPMQFFGLWTKTGVAHISAKKNTVEVRVPWWGLGEKARFEKALSETPSQTTDFPGLYLRLKDLLLRIP